MNPCLIRALIHTRSQLRYPLISNQNDNLPPPPILETGAMGFTGH